MAARKEAKIIRFFSAKLTNAIDLATGSNPTMLSEQLVANDFMTSVGTSSILQVAASPLRNMISQLVMNALRRIQAAANDQKAQKLFGLFLVILRELGVDEDLVIEMEDSYRGDGQERDNPMCKFCI